MENDELLLEGGRGRGGRTPPRGVLGYDPSDPASVEWTQEVLRRRLGHSPTLVHREPNVFVRSWRWLRAAVGSSPDDAPVDEPGRP